ncbi:hypothetical protein ACVW1A_003954 [Bradyrhizobium sp. LB1.3]
MNTTADALLAGGIKMIFHQPLTLKHMIAPRVGYCKSFNKLDQSRINVTWGYTSWCMMKHFPRLRTFHPRKMLRGVHEWQAAYTSVVELDTIESGTDTLSEAEKSGAELLFWQRSGREFTGVTLCKAPQPDRYERRAKRSASLMWLSFVSIRSRSLRCGWVVSGAKLVLSPARADESGLTSIALYR